MYYGNDVFARISLLFQKIFLLLHLKNHQNFKCVMSSEHFAIDSSTLRERIEAMPEDSVLFRSDFPEYHLNWMHN